MYLRQKCPSCKTEAEYVDVQIGHSHCCKNCNYEFTLEKKRFNPLPYIVTIVVIVVLVAGACFLFKVFYDWWVFRPNSR